jgi:hypothetical protein
MENGLINKIIDNFQKQHRLCEEMAVYAREQLEWLKKSDKVQVTAQVMEVMVKRQKLLEDLQVIDAENKNLQEQVLNQFNIDEFTLSSLKPILEAVQYDELKQAVGRLGAILGTISEVDDKNQLLMRANLAAKNKGKKVSNQQADNMYKQVRDLDKKF